MPQVIELGQRRRDVPLVTRRAVKAVAVRDGLVLMLRSSSGDYKFPGGGIEAGETDEDALVRELSEECGRDLAASLGVALEVVETRPDSMQEGTDFQMVSAYHVCDVGDEVRTQHLDHYEQDLSLTPVWVLPGRVVASHDVILARPGAAAWVARETLVLRWLMEHGAL